ncbi:hypothetical protein PTKIN_Ptkin10aG0079500 [Pterospermum kingtungense]
MNPHQSEWDLPVPPLASLRIQPTSPRVPLTTAATPTAGAQRRIAIAVDLSDDSAYAVRWAVQNYLRPGDAVILLHVRPTSVLYGADWGSIKLQIAPNNTANHESATAVSADEDSHQKLENEFDIFTATKANTLAQPLMDAQIPFKIHIVKDHDMKERLCLEVERLGLSAVIMGSRGFGAARRSSKGRLGSVSDYCVHHCICPVVVVRYPDEEETQTSEKVMKKKIVREDVELQPVPEEELEFHDAEEDPRGLGFISCR